MEEATRRLWRRLEAIEVPLGAGLRGREQELRCNWLRSHVVDLPHVDEEALGEYRDHDFVCAAGSASKRGTSTSTMNNAHVSNSETVLPSATAPTKIIEGTHI
jgi:hypothetical protein